MTSTRVAACAADPTGDVRELASVSVQSPRSARTAPGEAAVRALFVHSGNIFGGVETLLLQLATTARTGCSIAPAFALSFDGRLRDGLTGAGAQVHSLGAVRFSRPDQLRRGRRALDAVFATHEVDVCVTLSAWSHALAAPVARKRRVPVALWAHGTPNRRHWLEWLAWRTRPDGVIANSRHTAGAFAREYPGITVQVCPMLPGPSLAADEATRARDAVRRELTVTPDDVVLVQAGRFETLKGYHVLLEALASMPRDIPWRCWLAGSAHGRVQRQYVNALRTRTATLGIADRVRFLGERHDIARVLSAADIYCQPNVGPETLGLTFLEAMHAGLPIVTSPIGGAVELVDASCGHFAEPGNARAVTAALTRLVRDPDERRALGSAGRTRAQALSDPSRQLAAFAAALRSYAAAGRS